MVVINVKPYSQLGQLYNSCLEQDMAKGYMIQNVLLNFVCHETCYQ